MGGQCETQEGFSEFTVRARTDLKGPHLTTLTVRAPPSAAVFVMVIIKAPIIQILSVVLAGFIIALEFPAPPLKRLQIHRSIVMRIPLLLIQAFFAVLFYQVSPCCLVPACGMS